ncbi:MAG: DEAD/DEAH box helicase [Chloroflexota bacterium]
MARTSVDFVAGRILVRGAFELKDQLKATPTAKWEPELKAWAFADSPTTRRALRRILDGAMPPEAEEQALAPVELRTKVASWPHQVEASARVGQDYAFYLHAGMGCGKSKVCIDSIISYDFHKTLILCPSSVVRVWPGEFAKYAAGPVELVALDASVGSIAKRVKAAEMAAKRAAALKRPLVVVINYEAAWREPFAGWAAGMEWDLVVGDELHRCKAPAGKASKWVEGLRAKARHMVGLSGTPMPWGPTDIFAQFRALDPGIFGSSMTRFRLRYEAQAFVVRPDAKPDRKVLLALEQMDGLHGPWRALSTWGTDFAVAFQVAQLGLSNQDIVDALAYRAVSRGEEPRGYDWLIPLLEKVRKKLGHGGSAIQKWQHLDELRAKMDQITMHVGREVLSLTEATETVRHITLSPAERKAHDELAEDLATELDAGRVTAANALTKLLRLQQATGGFLKLDEADGGGIVQLGTSRAAVLGEVFEELREDRLDGERRHEPVVVFCRFHSDLDTVHRVALEVTGQDALELSGRVNQLAEWQQDGAAPVLAVQIQAGGLGVSMTRACFSVYFSIGYSLADLEQAKARVHRPGQTRAVTHIFLVADDTVDEHVYNAIKNKAEVVEHVLGKLRPKSKPNIVNYECQSCGERYEIDKNKYVKQPSCPSCKSAAEQMPFKVE